MWNMQSGRERRSFSLAGIVTGDSKPDIIQRAKTGRAKEKAKATVRSTQAITGLVVDALNTTVTASTLEGKLYVSDTDGSSIIPDVRSSISTRQSCYMRCNFPRRSPSSICRETTVSWLPSVMI